MQVWGTVNNCYLNSVAFFKKETYFKLYSALFIGKFWDERAGNKMGTHEHLCSLSKVEDFYFGDYEISDQIF